MTTDRVGAIGAMMLIIEPLIPRLRRYARSLMSDPATADDLVQDCLERAIRAWPQRREDGDARAWMFAILHNLAVSLDRIGQPRLAAGYYRRALEAARAQSTGFDPAAVAKRLAEIDSVK